MFEPQRTQSCAEVYCHAKREVSPPCYSCAEMVGKRRDKAAYSNAAPAFAKQQSVCSG